MNSGRALKLPVSLKITSNAVCSNMAFCASSATAAATSTWWRFPASGSVPVPVGRKNSILLGPISVFMSASGRKRTLKIDDPTDLNDRYR
jgi:hypothetical protein